MTNDDKLSNKILETIESRPFPMPIESIWIMTASEGDTSSSLRKTLDKLTEDNKIYRITFRNRKTNEIKSLYGSKDIESQIG